MAIPPFFHFPGNPPPFQADSCGSFSTAKHLAIHYHDILNDVASVFVMTSPVLRFVPLLPVGPGGSFGM